MKHNINKITFASAFGTLFEWYDFLIYGTAAALVFNLVFFPNYDPVVGMLLALLGFSLGFIARPIGGILFGHFGDKVGRKNTLMATMLLMGVSTFAIGLLPTYETIGVWAPILLVTLRLLQGIAFGGEWGGASVMILEHAPKERRGFYGSFIQVGYPAGVLVATGMFALVTQMPEADLISWGWRIPFLVSALLVAVGFYVRRNLDETPVFEDMQKKQDIVKAPLFETLFNEPKSLALGIGLKITEVTWAYLLTIFVVGYAVTNMQVPRSELMETVLIASAINLFAIPFFGWLSDVVGRRKIYIGGSVISILIAYPIFAMLEAQMFLPAMILGMLLGNALMMAPLSAYLPETFKSNIRFTGASFGCQVAAAIGGGIMPGLAAVLAINFGGLIGVAYLMIALSVVTLIAAYYAKETANTELV
jgi:MFS transporter, MHS family, shikimate and dehydroshikimate transport protein